MTRWLVDWPTAYPRGSGRWTVRHGDQWGVLDPERGRVEAVDPSADQRLPGITDALRAGRLVGYRHERRAIVATPTSFVKVLRPSRVDGLVERHELLAAAPFDVPRVLDVATDGRVELTTMAGRSLHQSLRIEPLRTFDDVAALVAALHAQPVSNRLGARTSDERQAWVATSRRSPTVHVPAIEQASAALPPLEQRDGVMVHGDLHDKNIFCDAARPSLIDLDGLALGAPEDDVANLAVHLELRNLQGRTGLPFGTRSGALYRSYRRLRDLDQERLNAAERHTWFRLACLYQYRAASSHLVPRLLRAAGDESGQDDGDLSAAEGARTHVK